MSDAFETDIVASYPDVDQVEEYAKKFDLPAVLIRRDISRIVLIGVLSERGWLNEDRVLTGGMALRLRGSTRFTMLDSDTSMRGRLDEVELTGKMKIETDDLVVTPDEGTNWDRRTKLTIAKPITYEAYFASVDPANPETDEFTFTVSQRGLHMPAEDLPLVTPYSELNFTREIRVPVMHITEQAAEKAVGWTAAGLAKHYVDLAWIVRKYAADIETPVLQHMAQEKLDVGRGVHGTSYDDFREWRDLLRPLMRPNDHVAPLNVERNDRKSEIRFLGEKMRWDEAVRIVQTIVLPLLFGRLGGPPR